jgi:hypothetical protein
MRTFLRLVFPFALVSLFVLPGCVAQTACTTDAQSSVTVTVVDATGAVVTDAVVTFTVDSGTLETCAPLPDGTSCTCGYEREGTFAVTAIKGGMTNTRYVTITKSGDACHVEGQSITITL